MALATSAASSVTVATHASISYTISGGGGSQFVSYQASSSNAQVAIAKVDSTKLIINGASGGTAAINVTDNAGANVTMNVTVPTAGVATLSLAAPALVTAVPGTTAQYKVSVA